MKAEDFLDSAEGFLDAPDMQPAQTKADDFLDSNIDGLQTLSGISKRIPAPVRDPFYLHYPKALGRGVMQTIGGLGAYIERKGIENLAGPAPVETPPRAVMEDAADTDFATGDNPFTAAMAEVSGRTGKSVEQLVQESDTEQTRSARKAWDEKLAKEKPEDRKRRITIGKALAGYGRAFSDKAQEYADEYFTADEQTRSKPFDQRLSDDTARAVLTAIIENAPNTALSLGAAKIMGKLGKPGAYAGALGTSYVLESGDIFQSGVQFLEKKYGGLENVPDHEYGRLIEVSQAHGLFNAGLDAIMPGNIASAQARKQLADRTIQKLLSKESAKEVGGTAIKNAFLEAVPELAQEESSIVGESRIGIQHTDKDILNRKLQAAIAGAGVGGIAGAASAAQDIRARNAEVRKAGGEPLKADDFLDDVEELLGGEARQTKPAAPAYLPPPRMIVTPEGEAVPESQFEQRARGMGLEEVARARHGRAPIPPEPAAPPVQYLPPPRIVVTPDGQAATEAQFDAARRIQAQRAEELGTSEVKGAVHGRVPLPPLEPEAAPLPPEPDDLLKAVARAGGINREAAKSEGIDPAHFKDARSRQVFGRPLFPRSGGMTMDALAEWLSQRGYLPEGQYYANDALDLLSRALSGEKIYSFENQQAAFERQARQYEDDQREAERASNIPRTSEDIRQTADDLRKAIQSVQKNIVKRTLGIEDWTPTRDDFGLSGYSNEDEETQDLSAVMYDGRRIMGDDAFEAFFERFSVQNQHLDGASFESKLREAIRRQEDAKSRVPEEDRQGARRESQTVPPRQGQDRPQAEASVPAETIPEPPAARLQQTEEVTPPQSQTETAPIALAPSEPARPASDDGNKIFTREQADRAREILRRKLSGQLNSGLDPEMMQAGMQIAGYYIERGARSFRSYSAKMIADLGEAIRPYLKAFYLAVRNWPGFDTRGMDTEAEIDAILSGKGPEAIETDLAGPVDRVAQAIHDEMVKKDERRNGTKDVPMSAGPGDLFSDRSKQADLFAPMAEAAKAMAEAAKALTETVKSTKENANAQQDTEASQPDANVRQPPRPEERQGEMPAAEGRQGVREGGQEAPAAVDVEQKILDAESSGVVLSDSDKDAIQHHAAEAARIRDQADRIIRRSSDPMGKGNAFPMGVGYTRMTKRKEQAIDRSISMAGEASKLYEQAIRHEKLVESMLSGKNTEADKAAKARAKEAGNRKVVEALVNWKPGVKFGKYDVVRVNRDKDGYPASFTITGEGIVKGVMDKVDVVKELFGGDKDGFRSLVDEIRQQSRRSAGPSTKIQKPRPEVEPERSFAKPHEKPEAANSQPQPDSFGKNETAQEIRKLIGQSAAPAQAAPVKQKKSFTYAVKPTAGGFKIESDDGGGIVLSRKPTGPSVLDNVPPKVFKTRAVAELYAKTKGMRLKGNDSPDNSTPTQESKPQAATTPQEYIDAAGSAFDYGERGEYSPVKPDAAAQAKPESSEKPATESQKPAAQADSTASRIKEAEAVEDTKPTPSAPTSLVQAHEDYQRRVDDGKVTVEEFKQAFDRLVSNEKAIKAELAAMKKDDLLKQGGQYFAYRYKNDTKPRIVDALYIDMIGDFAFDGVSFMIGGGNYQSSYIDAVRKQVDAITPERLAKHAEKVRAARVEQEAKIAALQEAVKDPKTLEDFETFLRVKKRADLTQEQRERYDELLAEKSRSERASRKTQERTTVQAAGATTGAEIIATKHTRDGYDLFVVKPAERVERDVYNAWNTAAKKLGGWYSSFRGNGAIPGFQFKTREAAEAFQKYVSGGDTDAVQEQAKARRDAFEDDRSQTAVERLREMADKLEERADDSLNKDRKTNTARRARMASNAEAGANYQKALAATMRNIAQAIEDGRAKFLDRIRTKAQVEMLNGFVTSAKYRELREKYKDYIDREKHKYDKPTSETVEYAEWPTYTAYRSDLARLGREFLEVDGLKQIGQRILKVANDVSDAYNKFARENLHKVSRFRKANGGLPSFPTRDAAESSIEHSGFKGKAIALQIKRGEHTIVLSPSEAQRNGIWTGDDDKRITLTPDFGAEIVEKSKRRSFDLTNRFSYLHRLESTHEERKRLAAMGIETPAEFRSALREFIRLREAPPPPDKVKEMERAMIGRRKDGLDFFPTPSDTADKMVQAADIKEGMSVLEPSAGMGHIADRIRDAGFDVDVAELSGERRELLEAKGYNVVGTDFMEMSDKQYDRIIMNPPFSGRRDIQHVQHAYELLKPGGRLVAIMSEGVFFGSDKKATEFREWLERVGGTDEKLDEGSFLDQSLPVNTGANARMVVIDKPESAAMFSRRLWRKDEESQANDQRDKQDYIVHETPEFDGNETGDGGLPVSGITLRDLEATVARVTQGHRNLPPIITLESPSQAPEALREKIEQAGAMGDVEGAFHDGKVYLFADNLRSEDRAEHVLMEHEIGHYGLRGVFGKDLDPVLSHIYLSNEKIRKAANARRAAYGLKSNVAAVEEVLVDMPAAELPRLKGWDRLVSFLRDWFLAHGFKRLADRLNATLVRKHGEQGAADLFAAEVITRAREWARSGRPAAATQLYMGGTTKLSLVQPAGMGISLPDGIDANLKEKAAALEEAGQSAGAFKITSAKLLDAVLEGTTAREDLQAVKVLQDLFRAPVALLATDGEFKFNGVYYQGMIWLDINSPVSLPLVFGHELSHRMKADNPSEYSALLKAVSPMFRNMDAYEERYHLYGMKDDLIAEEMLGDVMGDRFGEPEFWRQVAANTNRSEFRKIIDTILLWIGRAIARLRGLGKDGGLGSGRFISDLEAARKIIAKAVADYAEERRQGADAERQGGAAFSRQTPATDAAAKAERDNMPAGVLAHYKARARKIIERIDRALSPVGGLPESHDYLAKRYRTLGIIANADAIAKGIGRAFGTATPDDRVAVYDYLTTRGAKPGGIRNELVRAEAVKVKRLIESVGDAMVARGLLSEEAREAHRGSYLPQLYLKWLLNESDVKLLGAGKKPGPMEYLKHLIEKWLPNRSDAKLLGAGKKPGPMGYLKRRKIERIKGPDGELRFVWRESGEPLTDAQVLDLGPISDPGFLAATAIATPIRDMALLDFLAQISENTKWALPESLVEFEGTHTTPYWLKDEADRLRRQAYHYGAEDARKAREIADRMDTAANKALKEFGITTKDLKHYRQIPNTRKYGRLRGLWVRKEIYDDLVGVYDLNPTDPGFVQSLLGYGGIGTKITQLWKMGKVSLNPPSQVRNFVSNMILLQLSGVPLHRIPGYIKKAVGEIANNGDFWKIAKKYGVTESTFATQELYRIRRDLLDLEMREGRLNVFGKLHRIGAIIADQASDAYQFMEALGKTIKIMHAMDSGKGEAEAAIEAQKWLFDYSLVPKSVRYARNAPIGIPFLTFYYKALPRLAEVALLHPQRLIPWVALFAGWPMVWAALTGEDDDEYERLQKAAPQWLQERGHAMILPWQDDEGRWQVADLGYFMPWSMYTDLMGDLRRGELGEAAQTLGLFSGPVTNVIVAMKTGKDPFTGRDIMDPGDPPARQFVAGINYMYDMMMPPIVSSRGLVSPMGLLDVEYGGKAVQAATGRTNKYGDPTATGAQAALYPFGINIYSLEPQHSAAQNVLRLQYEADQTELALKRKLQNRGLSEEAQREIVQEYTDELKRRHQRIEEYLR